ncbi:MAG: hypothetical protein AAGF85_20570 [Bacteroidota bacterium]
MDKYFDDIIQGKFEFVKEIPLAEIKDSFKSLIRLAYQTENIEVLKFVQFLNDYYHNDHELKYLIAELIVTAFNYLPDGYKMAFDYAKGALDLNENDVSYKEFILLFYNIPDKLLSREQAEKYAYEILKADPDNKAAQLILI